MSDITLTNLGITPGDQLVFTTDGMIVKGIDEAQQLMNGNLSLPEMLLRARQGDDTTALRVRIAETS
jgi:hypothetical protein